ncbi:Protein of unknown function DUF4535 [Cinara cedri]|uniref:Uncharacterized protein n=2 Tax=Cinara cedri TaxID=506608 RepID=A0A5E4MIS8_9HEMI|nr:Protein of unknown function DUF4535 [Cinara cedri]
MTYSRNIDQIFVILQFLKELIFSNKMGVVSHFVALGLGVYSGIYVAQNYEVAKVDEPSVVIDKLKRYLEEILKPKS